MTASKRDRNETEELAHAKQFQTVSARIRYLTAVGWSRGKISKALEIRYQHVRNVLVTPVQTPREQV